MRARVHQGIAGVLVLLVCGPGVWAEEQKTTSGERQPTQQYVTVEDFNRLKTSYEQLQQEVQQLKAASATPQPSAPKVARESTVSPDEFDQLKEQVNALRPGLTNFLLTGYGSTTYSDARNAKSNFTAAFNPIFLWKLSDRLLFESEVEFELGDSSTTTNLEYADISYLLNDYMTVEAGRFLSPFGVFTERLHPKWINKLADKPLVYAGGSTMLVPESEQGAQIRGAIPLGEAAKTTYALWMTNGPGLNTDATNAGTLDFDRTTDANNHKAFGGRVALFPIPEVEVGYSTEFARVGALGTAFSKVDAYVQGMDVSYVHDSAALKGAVDLKSEWLWSHVQPINYGTNGGRFRNDRWGGYVQAAYRPTFGDAIIRKLEPVVRFDMINQPDAAPNNQDEERFTFGVNYHLSSRAVLKAAYEADELHGGKHPNTVLAQVAVGF